VEVLLEPARPRPLVAVVGESPAARTLAELVRTVGWRTTADLDGTADAVVVATMAAATRPRSLPRSATGDDGRCRGRGGDPCL
jgi:hypothetical protein